MSDIFNIIKANLERNNRKSPVQREEEPSEDLFYKKKKKNIDDFLIGENEKNYRKKQDEKKLEILEEEVGIEKTKRDYLKSVDVIDFVQLDRMRDKDKIKRLSMGYLDLIDLIKEITKEINELEENFNKRSIEVHQTRKEMMIMKEFVRGIVKILPDGGMLQERVDTSAWNIEDIREEIFQKFMNVVDRIKNAEVYVEEQTKAIAHENKQLKRQIVKYEAAMIEMEQRGADVSQQPREAVVEQRESVIEKEEAPIVAAKPVAPVVEPKREEKPVMQSRFQDIEEAEEEEEDNIVVLEIDQYLSNLSDQQRIVIDVIGTTGISRNQELRTFLENDEQGNVFVRAGKFDYKTMVGVIKGLRDAGFLEGDQVKLGARGGYNYTVYELSKLGKSIYKSISGKNAAVSEKKRIVDQHKSVEHGFLIKDVAELFQEMEWTVYTDREHLRYDLPGGKRKDFDIVMEKDGEKIHIEVERGTHNDPDFFDAMDKIYQITSDFYFVSPNEKQMYGKTRMQFYKWINERLGGVDKVKGKMTVSFAKFEDIKQKKKQIWNTVKL